MPIEFGYSVMISANLALRMELWGASQTDSSIEISMGKSLSNLSGINLGYGLVQGLVGEMVWEMVLEFVWGMV